MKLRDSRPKILALLTLCLTLVLVATNHAHAALFKKSAGQVSGTAPTQIVSTAPAQPSAATPAHILKPTSAPFSATVPAQNSNAGIGSSTSPPQPLPLHTPDRLPPAERIFVAATPLNISYVFIGADANGVKNVYAYVSEGLDSWVQSLTKNAVDSDISALSYSSAGAKIAYAIQPAGQSRRVEILDLKWKAGDAYKTIVYDPTEFKDPQTNQPLYQEFNSPALSSDGDLIAFAARKSSSPQATDGYILVGWVDPGQGNPTEIIRPDIAIPDESRSLDILDISWAPTGAYGRAALFFSRKQLYEKSGITADLIYINFPELGATFFLGLSGRSAVLNPYTKKLAYLSPYFSSSPRQTPLSIDLSKSLCRATMAGVTWPASSPPPTRDLCWNSADRLLTIINGQLNSCGIKNDQVSSYCEPISSIMKFWDVACQPPALAPGD